MSFLDSAKDAAKKAAEKGKEAAAVAAEKSKDFAAEHKDSVGKAIDKGGSVLDKQTKGKFHSPLSKVAGKAGEIVSKLPDKE